MSVAANALVPRAGEIFALPESEFRYGQGSIVARITGIRERVEYQGEPWWLVSARVAQGTPLHHGGIIDRDIYLRQASLHSTRLRGPVPAGFALTAARPDGPDPGGRKTRMLRNDLINLLSDHDNDPVVVRLGAAAVDVASVASGGGIITLVLDPDELPAALAPGAAATHGTSAP